MLCPVSSCVSRPPEPAASEAWKKKPADPTVIADIKELAKEAKQDDADLKEYCKSKGWEVKKLTDLTAGQAADLHRNLQDIAFTLA